MDELHHHHAHEEQIFWPALARTDADLSVVADLDAEHEAMRVALDVADTTMHALHARPGPEEAAAARRAINSLNDVLLAHLEHEERDLEPIAWQYHDASSMKAAEKAVRRAHRGRMGDLFAWLQDGAAPEDRAGLRRQVPAPVVTILTAVGGRRYRRDVGSVWAGR